jgi:hypothetical protein
VRRARALFACAGVACLFGAAALGSACGPSSPMAGTAARPDPATPGPSTDASPSATSGPDGAADAVSSGTPSSDAGADSGKWTPRFTFPYPGEWVHDDRAPDWCGLKVAKAPARDLPGFTWKACSGQRVQCSTYDFDSWPEAPHLGTMFVAQLEPLYRAGKAPLFHFAWDFYQEGRYTHRASTLQPLDGPVEAAVSHDLANPAGAAFAAHFEADKLALTGNCSRDFRVDAVEASWFEVGSLPYDADAQVWPNAWNTVKRGIAFDFAFGRSDDTLYVQLQFENGGGIHTFDRATGTEYALEKPGETLYASRAFPVEGGALYTAGAFDGYVAFMTPKAESRRVITAERGSYVHNYTVDRSDGDRLVWIEGISTIDGEHDFKLYTAPFTTEASKLQKHFVRDLPLPKGRDGNYNEMVANKGFVLLVPDTETALLTRLSDGAQWRIRQQADHPFSTPVWLDDEDLTFLTSRSSLIQSGRVPDSLLRVGRATLGPPSFPPSTSSRALRKTP